MLPGDVARYVIVLRFFDGNDLIRCADDRVVDLLGRFSQEKGAIQDGVALNYADHKGQAIEVG